MDQTNNTNKSNNSPTRRRRNAKKRYHRSKVVVDIDQNNPDTRVFHSHERVCETTGLVFYAPFDDELNDSATDAVGGIGRSIARRILAIDGVKQVALRPWTITIVISAAFDWDNEIIPGVRMVMDSLYHGWAVAGTGRSLRIERRFQAISDGDCAAEDPEISP